MAFSADSTRLSRRSSRSAAGFHAAMYGVASLPLLYLYWHYAHLTAIGHWQGDEYAVSMEYLDGGIAALIDRVSGWSPRPLSETALFAYFHLVEATGRQLIAPFLFVLWMLFVISAVVLCAQLARRRDGATALAGLALLCLPLFFLANTYAYDVFFWVQGAVAYLPTLFALAIVTVALAFVEPPLGRMRPMVTLGLVVAALSSELGAFVVIFVSAAALAQTAAASFHPARIERSPMRPVDVAVPLLCGLGVLYGMASHRFGDRNEIFGDPAIAQHPLASALAAATTLPFEIAGARPGGTFLALVALGALPKLLFAAGLAFAATGIGATASRVRWQTLLGLSTALLCAAFLSTFASFYQFGENCCGRHQVMRESYGMLALLALAMAATAPLARSALVRSRTALWLGLSLMVAGALLTSLPNWDKVQRSYDRFDSVRATMASNWEAGRTSGEEFVYTLRGDSYSGDPALPVGITPRMSVDFVTGRMLDFFGKTRIDVHAPQP